MSFIIEGLVVMGIAGVIVIMVIKALEYLNDE